MVKFSHWNAPWELKLTFLTQSLMLNLPDMFFFISMIVVWHAVVMLHHGFGRLRPLRRQNNRIVTGRLISADFHKICRKGGTGREHASVCYSIVSMVPRIWKHARVSMTSPRQLGWLGETISPSFFILQLFFFSLAVLTLPNKLLSALSSVFLSRLLSKWDFFSPHSFNQSDRPSPLRLTPSSPFALWELTGLCKELFCVVINTGFGQSVLCLLSRDTESCCVCEWALREWGDFSSLCNSK